MRVVQESIFGVGNMTSLSFLLVTAIIYVSCAGSENDNK